MSYVAGYQGTPVSHLIDVLHDANDILDDLGVRFESSEATAAATLAASVTAAQRRRHIASNDFLIRSTCSGVIGSAIASIESG